MPKQKQPPTIESVYEAYEQLELKDQIHLYKLIEQNLLDKQKTAQSVHNQLAQVVKERQ